MGEKEITEQRLIKLRRLRDRGVNPYPAQFHRTHTAKEALDLFQLGLHSNSEVTVAGRVTGKRTMGKAAFVDLRDGTDRIQSYLRRDIVGEEAYELLGEIDLGDFLGISGSLFRTRSGEVSVEARSYVLLAKTLRAPPEKWHGLQDVELRYRQRYLDLATNTKVRDLFRVRGRLVTAIRRFLDDHDFIEAETPVLQPTAGGAAARPFVTYHNAVERQLYLRIALELHLKRLIIGGYERVYELGRVFRNEGASAKYNPEYTLLETYQAYADYTDVMAMVEKMISSVAREVIGSTLIKTAQGEIDLNPPWRRITLRDAILEHSGIDFQAHKELASLQSAVADKGLAFDASWGRGKLIDELLSETTEPNLIQPTFVTDYPTELSPLAKCKQDDDSLVERFELFIGGMEIGNAYSELNDPVEQRRRFLDQARLRAAGDDEAERADEDFLVALEHGMPPTGGLGIGIDRLIMMLCAQPSIRDVILFPQTRMRGDA